MFDINKIKKPIKMLAPMAGYTDSPFRQICRGLGADLTMTELISADAIYFALKKSEKVLLKSKTYELLQSSAAERPLFVQLFGRTPERFLVAGEFLQNRLKVDGIDINFGCSVRKVLKSGHGAALLREPKLAGDIVKILTDNLQVPISVKTRIGFTASREIIDFLPEIVAAGAVMVTLHGRTAKAGFSGDADWETIYQVKKKYPNTLIIGNGDIKKYSEILEHVGNLDGVAIGRGALAAPWIFKTDKTPPLKDKIEIAWKQARLVDAAKGNHGIIELRKNLLWYFKGLKNAHEWRQKLVIVKNLDDIKSILKEIEKSGEIGE